MSFSSYEFIFLFLPIGLSTYLLLLSYRGNKVPVYFLIAASIGFYWHLDGNNIYIILSLVAMNYLFSILISKLSKKSKAQSKNAMVMAVCLNVFLFFYIKDFNFTKSTDEFLIPIGISFVIVQQVMFLIYTYEQDNTIVPAYQYGVFSLFFSYIIAGPVVRREEIFNQYSNIGIKNCLANFLPSLTLFSIGLFKKVAFADNIDPYVDQVFVTALSGEPLSVFDAWSGAILFTLQIYFDFSGYTDMAIGVAGFFGMSLPRNFHSPLKATSIMEFWRHWHRTMTRFFVDFVYLPLAVKMTRIVIKNRIGGVGSILFRLFLPLVGTFLVVGIWHGAGPNFVVFAVIMGVALAINQAWRKTNPFKLPPAVGWLCTMLVVVFALTLDRAPDFASVKIIWLSMLGINSNTASLLDIPVVSSLIFLLGAFVLLLPNSNQILGRSSIILRDSWDTDDEWPSTFHWSVSGRGVAFTACVLLAGVLLLTKAEDFIYYRF